jgi:ferredoxin-NADP reductase
MIDSLIAESMVHAHLGTDVDTLASGIRSVALIAGGTGITPMLAMITNRNLNVDIWLFWSLRSRDDLFLMDEICALQPCLKKVTVIFSEGDASGNTLPIDIAIGRVEASMFGGVLGSVDQVIVCGPQGFNSAVQQIAKSSGARYITVLA